MQILDGVGGQRINLGTDLISLTVNIFFFQMRSKHVTFRGCKKKRCDLKIYSSAFLSRVHNLYV